MKHLLTYRTIFFAISVTVVLSLTACQNAEELYHKGLSYINGDGVEKNIEKGISLLKKSAQMGSPLAIREVADVLYSQGVIDEAIIWYDKSILVGDASSARILGGAYMYGEEYINQDYSKAVHYYEKAIELDQSYSTPYVNLGHCYYSGKGVGIDYAKAAEYFRRAADLNDPVGLYDLGICYANGNGVPVDHNTALVYIRKAADLGQTDAIDYIEELKRQEREERERDRNQYVTCPNCHGTGKERGTGFNAGTIVTCGWCRGRGIMRKGDRDSLMELYNIFRF